MSTNRRFVIVGGGLAGAKIAEALRDRDFDGEITVLSEEDHLPYERPPLSKEFFAGKKTLPEFTVHDGEWFRDHRVDLRPGTTATAIDPAAHTVSLPDGSTISYDKLALATGSRSRRLDIPGSDAEGVHYVRTVDQAAALLRTLAADKKLVVIGAGWIGLEIAASARGFDVDVTVLEHAGLPLESTLGPEMGEVFAALHRQNGVDLRTGTDVTAISVDGGHASGVTLIDGTVIPADAVLIAVGALPNTELASEAGIDVENGVLVDAGLQSSDPDVVAVGDIAAAQHPILNARIRVEHWANALNQPETAAETMLGRPAEYVRMPYFFTDQYDLGMEYVGHAPHGGYSRVVTRGDVDKREFLAFWLDSANKVLAGMNVNIWDAGDAIKELVASSRPVDPERLADPEIPLAEVSA
ncbi:3-phenylpropionate/trans-cinnamate dioxygenase ferredoxin reductase subunit [Rhodococcus sp. OAS809]|uniref:NAD(P)/FAD-dependent oxidoreductase n=1 Tax=Rhodococcus TaxID=1827 RepID=UPI0002B7D07C|nr:MULTISPECIES: FAD-dependent oxidoreductase [Rhodococcus]EME20563.1 ferredoxin reductase [Rhodococcus qingshengii BKS 20-40]KLN69826.1 pyridine nucleotide-disulfide oxidoreductase [Rhodococcus erythropolis]MBW0284814.1 pyridine nucleotide-disulfide oxidoreductase [Rhodococcus sp. FH8]MDJ0488952.1 FAD-dependent oxidoreductase [Rhodococcus qingshengii]